MKIYTKTGDKGTTALYGGVRISKDSSQVEAYGSVDELTSYIGLITTFPDTSKDIGLLTMIQQDLYQLMSVLCNAPVDISKLGENITKMEEYINHVEEEKPTPHKFILVQGTQLSVTCHVARTVCRRTERRIVAFLSEEKMDQKSKDCMLQYLNRLSDMLYAMGRMYNTKPELLV